MTQSRRTTIGVSLLLAWLVAIAFVEVFQGRITPPGGFTWLDYGLMLCLPIGSFHASRYYPRNPLHFAYGAFGSLVFLVGYTSSGRFMLSLWDHSVLVITLGWCGFSVFMGLVCRFVASVRGLRKPPHGVCPGCGYNLTGNVSGVCSECGRPIGDEEAAL